MYHLAPPLDPEHAATIRERCARFNAWVDTRRNVRAGRFPREEEIPAELRGVNPTNLDKGLLDLCDFHAEPPAQLFAYVTHDISGAWQCANFPGVRYGTVHVGPAYKSPAFGRASTRRSVTLFAVNGWVYDGTF